MTAPAGVSYGYDDAGNQTSRGADTFSWNHENRSFVAEERARRL